MTSKKNVKENSRVKKGCTHLYERYSIGFPVGSLRGKDAEIFNYQKAIAVMADYGFECCRLCNDTLNADFIAYHAKTATALKVQLKSRPSVCRKYSGKEIYILFPHKKSKMQKIFGWFLVPHDVLISLLSPTAQEYVDEYKDYSQPYTTKKLAIELQEYRLISADDNA